MADGSAESAPTEKEPVTCNETMAKSVVTANDARVAITAEKDAVVRAATLLADQNDDLTAQLKAAKEEMAEMARAQSTLEAEHETALKEATIAADLDLREVERTLSDERADREAELRRLAEEAVVAGEEAERKIAAEVERSRTSMDALKNATSATIARVETEAADKLAAKDVEVAEKLEAARLEVE